MSEGDGPAREQPQIGSPAIPHRRKSGGTLIVVTGHLDRPPARGGAQADLPRPPTGQADLAGRARRQALGIDRPNIVPVYEVKRGRGVARPDEADRQTSLATLLRAPEGVDAAPRRISASGDLDHLAWLRIVRRRGRPTSSWARATTPTSPTWAWRPRRAGPTAPLAPSRVAASLISGARRAPPHLRRPTTSMPPPPHGAPPVAPARIGVPDPGGAADRGGGGVVRCHRGERPPSHHLRRTSAAPAPSPPRAVLPTALDGCGSPPATRRRPSLAAPDRPHRDRPRGARHGDRVLVSVLPTARTPGSRSARARPSADTRRAVRLPKSPRRRGRRDGLAR
jgi:hypothetical protein